jgi:hypothetical protein
MRTCHIGAAQRSGIERPRHLLGNPYQLLTPLRVGLQTGRRGTVPSRPWGAPGISSMSPLFEASPDRRPRPLIETIASSKRNLARSRARSPDGRRPSQRSVWRRDANPPHRPGVLDEYPIATMRTHGHAVTE